MKSFISIFCGLLLTSASIVNCQTDNSLNSDVQLLAEYLVINETLDSLFVRPLEEIIKKATEIDVEAYGIVVAIAKFESVFRSSSRIVNSSKGPLSELQSKLRNPEMRSYFKSVEKLIEQFSVSVSKAIEIFEEIDGDSYRFMARSDEIVELMEEVGQFQVIEKSGVKNAVYRSAHRILGW